MAHLVNVIESTSGALGVLARHLELVGCSVQNYSSAEAFLKDRSGVEGCVVTDLRLPGMNGLELLRQLLADNYSMPIILVTADSDVALAVDAMEAVERDLYGKSPDFNHLMEAVRLALDHSEANFFRGQNSPEVRRRLGFLSERERQVLDALVAGKPNKVIARDLNLSPRTIEGYRATVMAKMQSRTLSSLIRMVLVGSIDS